MNRRNFIVAAIATGSGLIVGLKKVMANNLAQEKILSVAPEEVSVIKRGMPEASDADFRKYPLTYNQCYYNSNPTMKDFDDVVAKMAQVDARTKSYRETNWMKY